jgi:hypothetical protein
MDGVVPVPVLVGGGDDMPLLLLLLLLLVAVVSTPVEVSVAGGPAVPSAGISTLADDTGTSVVGTGVVDDSLVSSLLMMLVLSFMIDLCRKKCVVCVWREKDFERSR